MGCVGNGVKSRRVTARPKETHLQPEIPSSCLLSPRPPPQNKNQQNKNNICHRMVFLPPPPNFLPYRGRGMGVCDRINLRTLMLTHNRTLRPVSLSRKGVWFCFIFFPFLSFFSFFWDFLLLLLGRGELFFFSFFK